MPLIIPTRARFLRAAHMLLVHIPYSGLADAELAAPARRGWGKGRVSWRAGRRAGSVIFFSGRLGGHLAPPPAAEVLGEGCVLAHGEDFGDHKEWAGGRPATMIWSSSSVDSTSRTPIFTRRCYAPLLRAAVQRLCRVPRPCPPPTRPKGGFGLSHQSRSWSGDKSATNPLG